MLSVKENLHIIFTGCFAHRDFPLGSSRFEGVLSEVCRSGVKMYGRERLAICEAFVSDFPEHEESPTFWLVGLRFESREFSKCFYGNHVFPNIVGVVFPEFLGKFQNAVYFLF